MPYASSPVKRTHPAAVSTPDPDAANNTAAADALSGAGSAPEADAAAEGFETPEGPQRNTSTASGKALDAYDFNGMELEEQAASWESAQSMVGCCLPAGFCYRF